jgi:hypothetical protein
MVQDVLCEQSRNLITFSSVKKSEERVELKKVQNTNIEVERIQQNVVRYIKI